MRLPHVSKPARPWIGFVAVMLAGVVSIFSEVVTDADHLLLDTQFRLVRKVLPQPVRDDPVIVGIDEAFLDGIDEPLALSHLYLSRFLQTMGEAGAQVVALDLVLPEKRFDTILSSRDEQLDFHRTLLKGLLQSIQQYPLIAAKVWDQDRRKFHDIQTDYAAVLGMQETPRQALASALFCPDADGRIRRYPGAQCQPDRGAGSFTSAIAEAAGIRQDWSGLIDYRLGGAFAYVPLQDVLKRAEQGDLPWLKQRFEGKVVLLGTVLDDVDQVDLPVALAEWRPSSRRVAGVLAQAQILRAMFNGGFLQPVPPGWIALLCALFALFWFGESILVKLALLSAASGSLLLASGMLLGEGWWLPPAAIVLTGLLAFGGRSLLQGWRHYRDKQRLNRMFSGSVSPAVMKELLDGGLDTSRTSHKLSVCVLFADIRNFTTLSEKLSAEEVVSLLNRYFTRMVGAIHGNGGTVDKFMGDGVMAFFGAPNPLACPERSALDAASDMLRGLAEFNGELVAEGRAPIQIGIGLHSGEAVVGHIGSAERHEYTAIGDTVNVASRLEGLCKEAGYPVVCSEHVALAAGSAAMMVPLGEKPLKGRSSMRVYGWQPEAGQG